MSNKQVNFNVERMGHVELVNVGLLLTKANELGIKLDSSTYIGYNISHANTYLCSERVNYSLFINSYDDSNTINICYTCPIDGDEIIDSLDDVECIDTWLEPLLALTESKSNY